jgi:hypothetical protein
VRSTHASIAPHLLARNSLKCRLQLSPVAQHAKNALAIAGIFLCVNRVILFAMICYACLRVELAY